MKSILLIFTLTLLFVSCSDENTTNPPTGGYNTITISGKPGNWDIGVAKLRLEVIDETGTNYIRIDSTTTAADGSFTLTAKELNVPLRLFTSYSTGNCTTDVNTSASNLRFTTLVLNAYDTQGRYKGYVEYRKDMILTTGNFSILYAYFDKASTVTGSVSCTSGLGTMKNNFNFNAVAGWNKLYVNYDRYILPSDYEATITNQEPTGGEWWLIKQVN